MEVTRFLPLLGRLLIGLPFLMSGVGKLTTYAATTAYIGSVGLPLAPIGWAIAVAFEIGGGLLLVVGFRTREVAFGLAVFVLATAVFFHRNFADQNQMIHFLKNIMIMGGLLQIAHFGAGRSSLDARNPRGIAGARSRQPGAELTRDRARPERRKKGHERTQRYLAGGGSRSPRDPGAHRGLWLGS